MPTFGTEGGGAVEPDPWWRTAVVYQIYPRSFADSDGDGIGDLRGLIGKLDYLCALGVDVLWLCPIYPSPQEDNGYDISDYQAVDPVFGTLEDFDELLAKLHRRDLKLVLDLVVNHTSDEHRWFAESRSSTTNPKRDWYWWRPPRPGTRFGEPGAEPTNWASRFSGPAWTPDELTGEYYLHVYSPKQPDLNWENPDVRQAVYRMMRWWLDRGVDGFRMDVINMISKDPALPDGQLVGAGPFGDGSPHYIGGPRLHEFLAEMHREVFAERANRLLTVAEMPGISVDEALRCTDPVRAEVDMVFPFEHVELDYGTSKWDRRPLQLRDLKACLARWQSGMAERGWTGLYWNNHDQPRAVSRFGDDRRYRVESAKLLATVLHMHHGTPYIYQGEELGMTNAPFEQLSDFRDVQSLNHYRYSVAAGAEPEAVLAELRLASRDNGRTPMQWTGRPGAGFTDGKPWLGINPNAAEINAADQVNDPDSIFAHYRKLIDLRHREPVVAHGDYGLLLPDHETVYAFTRRYRDQELLVLANFSSGVVRLSADDLPGHDAWARSTVLVGNYPDPFDVLVLQPWEARVHRRYR